MGVVVGVVVEVLLFVYYDYVGGGMVEIFVYEQYVFVQIVGQFYGFFCYVCDSDIVQYQQVQYNIQLFYGCFFFG